MRNKIVALILSTAMMTSVLTACGNEVQTGTESSQVTSSIQMSEENDASSEVAQEDEEPVELTVMANFGELGKTGEKWIAQLEEAVNVKINWVLPATSAYDDQLQLMMLDDEKPDVVLLPDSWLSDANFSFACEEGMFIDVADMIPEYENIMAHTADISWQALDILQDDRVWGIPRSTMARCDGFMLKKEWLDALKIDYSEGDYLTADEYFDILYKFTYDDPDGNGADDTYGLKVYTDANGKLRDCLYYIFGIGDTDAWGLYDGEYMALKYSQTMSNFKEYLAFANKCWEAGVIDPDAFSIDLAVANERFESGMYGSSQTFAGYLKYTPTDVRNFTDVYCPGVVPNEGDEYGFSTYSTGIWYFWAIPSTCERPDKVLELFDYALSDEQWVNLSSKGVEGFNFVIDEEGNYDFSLQDKLTDEEKRINPLDRFIRRSDGAEFFIDKKLSAEVREKLAKFIDIAVENYQPAYDRGYTPEIAKDPVFIEYNNFMNDQINKIIIGEKPVEYWDEVLQGWYDAGGTEYVADMQAYIASFEK